jgi:uncharacterized membrane protein (DUF2068 family)
MDWSLLGCGARGHFTFAPDEPELRERLGITTAGGTVWRCLRCGTFVSGPPLATGPVHTAPRIRRGKELRSTLILRAFAVERLLRAIVFGVLAYGIWRFSVSRISVEQAFDRELPGYRAFLRQFGYDIYHSKVLGLIQHAFTLNSRTLTWLAIAAVAYAVIEIIEAVGLWLAKRWGEYFAMVATSAGLPFEIYELIDKITVLRLLAFAVNLVLVAYLIITKRLLGVRGGKKAYEARLRTEAIIETELAALAAAKIAEAAKIAKAATHDAPTPGSRPPPPAGKGVREPDASAK